MAELNRDSVAVTWDEAKALAEKLRDKLPGDAAVFGIPLGGQYVAAMLAALGVSVTIDPSIATHFVDDVIDSGATAGKWYNDYGVSTIPLIDKRDLEGKRWIVFPWELANGEEEPTDAVTRLLQWIGEDLEREGLVDTPKRVCKALKEMCFSTGLAHEILDATFDLPGDQMVMLRGIRFSSLCEHHMLPFGGTAAVAYVASESTKKHYYTYYGISKLARVVNWYSHRLQTQERITHQVAHAIMNGNARPFGVGVVLRAHHSCMGCRGANQPDAQMVSSCMLGVMLNSADARAELMALA